MPFHKGSTKDLPLHFHNLKSQKAFDFTQSRTASSQLSSPAAAKQQRRANILSSQTFFRTSTSFQVFSTSSFPGYKPEDSTLHLSECSVHHSERREEGERSHQEVRAPIRLITLLNLGSLTLQWTLGVSDFFLHINQVPDQPRYGNDSQDRPNNESHAMQFKYMEATGVNPVIWMKPGARYDSKEQEYMNPHDVMVI